MNKKILSLLLALCMVLCLAACGGTKYSKADFEGTWKASQDLTKQVIEEIDLDELAEELGGDVSEFLDVSTLKLPEVSLVMDLKTDGTFTMAIDESCKQPIADAVGDWFVSGDLEGLFTQVLNDQGAEYGFTVDDMMAIFEVETMGELLEVMFEMPMEDYVEELRKEVANGVTDEFDLSEYAANGTWEYKNGTVCITVDGEEEAFEFNEEAFTLTEKSEDVTLVFKKAQ